jgi:hypothetical protein
VTIVAVVSCAAPNGSAIGTVALVASDTADPDPADNAAGRTATASNEPPTIAGAAASRRVLLLPLHQMVPVTINYTAADKCGPVTTSLTVTSDEPVLAPLREQGLAGLTSPDWEIVDAHHVLLRAERSSMGDGRVYTIRILGRDAAGGTTAEELIVTVPRWIAGLREDP